MELLQRGAEGGGGSAVLSGGSMAALSGAVMTVQPGVGVEGKVMVGGGDLSADEERHK